MILVVFISFFILRIVVPTEGQGIASLTSTTAISAATQVPYRSSDVFRSTREHTRRSRPVTTYDMLASYASSEAYRLLPTDQPQRQATSVPPSAPSRESSLGDQLDRKGYFSPSDTSIDESVKSAKADKEVINMLFKAP